MNLIFVNFQVRAPTVQKHTQTDSSQSNIQDIEMCVWLGPDFEDKEAPAPKNEKIVVETKPGFHVFSRYLSYSNSTRFGL